MDFLYSNFPPMRTDSPTFADAFYELLPQTDELDIAVGYITSDSLIELQRAAELNRVNKVNLIIGMHYFDRFTRTEYRTAKQLNDFLTQNNHGEVRLVTPFRFHGKLYSFKQNDNVFAGIIGSNNLSSIVDSRNGIYEASMLINDRDSLNKMDNFIRELNVSSTQNIADLTIEDFNQHNDLLEGQDYVEKVSAEELFRCMNERTELTFNIPIKDAPKSNLNVFFGKGRETMTTGVIRPRHWYESEIIVSKAITSIQGYPKANTDTASFNVITDDGWKFRCKVSGDYSKNFRTEGDLRILGKWLKGRLENADALAVGEPVTRDVLERYGRDYFSLTKTRIPDLWYLDFGVN
ncbi:MAG: NgoFVII family restriction endonuclease [Clostridia bacterium]|nr:NgoFVII family restriction endonuclease [Clostridia bacterium]